MELIPLETKMKCLFVLTRAAVLLGNTVFLLRLTFFITYMIQIKIEQCFDKHGERLKNSNHRFHLTK